MHHGETAGVLGDGSLRSRARRASPVVVGKAPRRPPLLRAASRDSLPDCTQPGHTPEYQWEHGRRRKIVSFFFTKEKKLVNYYGTCIRRGMAVQKKNVFDKKKVVDTQKIQSRGTEEEKSFLVEKKSN